MMPLAFSPYVLPLLISALLAALLSVYTWPRRYVKGASSLLLITVAITIWTVGYAFEIMATSMTAMIWWSKIQYLGIAFLPYFWLLFSIFYTSPNPHRWWPWLRWLVLLPVATLLLAFTNEWHGLLWAEIALRQVSDLVLLDTRYGIWFWLNTAASYLFLFGGTVILLRHLWHRSGLYRAQVVAVAVAALSPWLGNVLYLSGISELLVLDLTPFALTVTTLALGWAVLGYRLVDIVPIARDLVLDRLHEGVIVVDDQGRVADINPAAARIIGLPVSQAVGKMAASLLAPWPHLLTFLRPGQRAQTELVTGHGEAAVTHRVLIVPLHDQLDAPLGQIITIQAEREAAQSEPVVSVEEADTAVTTPTSSRQPRSVRAVANFFFPPPLENIDNSAGDNPLLNRPLEQAFTITLRFVVLVALAAVLVASSYWLQQNAIPILIGFLIGVAVLAALSLVRAIPFVYRIRLCLITLYGIALVELLGHGYSIEAFLLFFGLSILALLLQGVLTGLFIGFLSIASLAIVGWLIVEGSFIPPALSPTATLPPQSFDSALGSLLIFIASFGGLAVTIGFLIQSINQAWLQEIQSRNLLQQERDRLDEHVTARTSQLQQREAQQRALLQAIPDLIFRNHRDGTFLESHVDTPDRLMLPPDQFIGKKPEEILPPEIAQPYMAHLQQVAETGKGQSFEYSLMVEGQPRYYEARMVAVGPDEVLTIVRNITERRKLEAQTIVLTLEKERSQLLRAFVQNTSHEFRTPLSIIDMTLSNLDQVEDKQWQERSLERARLQIPRLVRLLDMTLRMVRLDNADVVFQLERVNLNQFLEQVAAKFRTKAVQKDLTITINPDTVLPPVPVDPNWLQEGILCLLENSIRFTPKGGQIIIGTAYKKAQAIIKIEDTGLGISPENMPRVFERFWRLDKAHSQPGFGLGLPIAQKIVEMHQGTLALESQPDKGTTVTICLPLP